jgi:DNA-binding Lrp family transcriptional regulator
MVHVNDALDATDQRVLAALQLDGRASWATVARAVGSSESTVQRRYNALVESGAARVIAVVDVLRCGLGIPVLVRVATQPGKSLDVARQLAARPQARFVAVLTGGADAVAEFVVPDHGELSQMLIEDLPAAELITRTETLTVMRTFTSAHDWDPHMLDGAATSLLRREQVHPFEDQVWRQAPDVLDDLELAIAATLGEDGRAPLREVAAQTGTSESTASRRIESMIRRGCLRFRTLVEPSLLGFSVEFMLWIDVAPADLEPAGRQLATHPATKYLSATTGRFNLCAQIALRHFADLYPFTTDVIGALPGVHRAESTLQLDTLKRAWVPTSPAAALDRRE